MEETLSVVDSCISKIKWRISPTARRRLHTDIVALCTRVRPVVMVDYGGKVPELTDHLCRLLDLCREASPVLLSLIVMIIEDMIYMIHIEGLTEYLEPTSQNQLLFIDLDHDPPKLLPFSDQNKLLSGVIDIQRKFSSLFQIEATNKYLVSSLPKALSTSAGPCPKCPNSNSLSTICECNFPQSNPLDFSVCIKDTDVVIPTLNGWLLGYPAVYLFSKEHISDAIFNLSTKSLHIYKILARRKEASGGKQLEEEIMSFSVPYDLSLGGAEEPWARTWFESMLKKFESCGHVFWSSLRMEVSACYSQAIVL
ncbi:uncharacterized protein LOC144716307 isoform X2 [Wolffia australiana]